MAVLPHVIGDRPDIQQNFDALMLQGLLYNVGDVKWKATSDVDQGWLAADGSGVTTANPTLRAKLITSGSPHGTDGSGNPKLPNLHDNVPVGAGGSYALGATFGAANVTLTAAQSGLPSHAHNLNGNSWDPAGPYGLASGANATTLVQSPSSVTQDAGGSDASSSHENRPPSVALYAFVKT